MQALLTVKFPASDAARLLATVARVEDDLVLDLEGDATAFVERAIRTASARIARHIGVRSGDDGKATLARETLVETFPDAGAFAGYRAAAPLTLSRYPVAQIVKVSEDGSDYPRLLPDQSPNPEYLYELSPQVGFLWKTSSSGERVSWSARRVAVEYEGGYITAGAVEENAQLKSTLPEEIEDACVEWVKLKVRSLKEDPEGAVATENIPGLWSGSFAPSLFDGGLPPFIAASLEPYVRVEFF